MTPERIEFEKNQFPRLDLFEQVADAFNKAIVDHRFGYSCGL